MIRDLPIVIVYMIFFSKKNNNFETIWILTNFQFSPLYFNVVVVVVVFSKTIDEKSAICMPFSLWSTVSVSFFYCIIIFYDGGG